MTKIILSFIFGATLAVFGFPIPTYQYWILTTLFCLGTWL